MDSARFIRKKSVLAAWLAVPLLLALIAEYGSAGFREHQQIAWMRAQMLEQLIPRLQAEAQHFGKFIADYEMDTVGGPTVEDVHIARVGEAAQSSEFTVESLSVTQEPVNPELGVGRIRVSLRGSGTARETANFFKQLKNKDPLVYEEQVRLTRAPDRADQLEVEAVLGKVYTRRGRGGRP